MKPSQRDILNDLLRLPTAPLCEWWIADYIQDFCTLRPALGLQEDRYGNLLVTSRKAASPTSQAPLVLAAHMDHPGFQADRMTDEHRLQAFWRGGVQPDYFPEAKVRFHSNGKWIRGVIHATTLTQDELGRERVETLLVDVREPVEPGSIGMWDLPDPTFRNGRVYARGCDDIAGLAAVLCALSELDRQGEPAQLCGLFTRAEEIGFGGALAIRESQLVPEGSSIISVECSSEIPGVKMGNGPILRVGDRRSIFTPHLTSHCEYVAESVKKRDDSFRFQRKLMDGGVCEATIFDAAGYDVTGICLALGNYHNMNRQRHAIGAEYINLEDFEMMVEWFVELARTPVPESPHQKGPLHERLGQLQTKLLPELERTKESNAPENEST